jgi:hypothetical protein
LPDLPPPSRRRALSLLAALPVARAGAAAPGQSAAAPPAGASLPDGVALLVAGPPQGRLDRWADLLLPALGRVLPSAARPSPNPSPNPSLGPVVRSAVGGADGVTGANQFEARVAPDGGTALLLPGSAATAWLVGDPRARFDAAGWVPAWAGLASAVLVSRAPLASGRPLRVGSARPAGPTLPALLALDLLGIEVTPCDDRTADAVFLSGQGARAAVALQRGMAPVLTLGALDPAGAWGRDPAFPAVPTAAEAVSRHAPPALLAALRAASAAALLDAALVLPRLSPANRVALWRRACAEASGTAALANEAAALGVRAAPAPAAAVLMAAVAADVPTLLALRGWLDARWGSQPG